MIKKIILSLLIVGLVMVAGCTTSSNTGYSAYNNQPPRASGGGCGVSGNPIVQDIVSSSDNALSSTNHF